MSVVSSFTLLAAASGAQGSPAADDNASPFHISIPQAALDDLRRRVLATQWPEKETVTDTSQGVPLATMRELARYWATDYDWRKVQAKLNALPHGGRAEDAFDVVIPSMPGYGFSGKPTSTGWGPERMGRAWAELMKRLGYTRYVAQGGDWGACTPGGTRIAH